MTQKFLYSFAVLYFVKILSAALLLHAGRRADILIDFLQGREHAQKP